jgi:hypothetical protein
MKVYFPELDFDAASLYLPHLSSFALTFHSSNFIHSIDAGNQKISFGHLSWDADIGRLLLKRGVHESMHQRQIIQTRVQNCLPHVGNIKFSAADSLPVLSPALVLLRAYLPRCRQFARLQIPVQSLDSLPILSSKLTSNSTIHNIEHR